MHNRAVSYQWKCKPFDALSVEELYNILRLRTEVFILEQNCLYQDVDGKDVKAFHLFASEGEVIIAYSRIFAPGVLYPEASIGRVANNKNYRRNGLGKELMKRSIEFIDQSFPNTPIRIAAQSYLLNFYGNLGFKSEGDEFLEDDIPHHHMIRPASGK